MHPDRDTTATILKEHWRPLGLRCLPELRRELKIAAATRGEPMEDLLHRILCHALGRPDLDPDCDCNRDRVA